ncbi:peroxisomal multifunctional enzyme type 2-like [Papilio machaon]|uniref:peroxisomal multifunctional enzyme type 2-like n=1 Tax=Papilio machaon TaxID=76193 RepID=UPI001E665708|nr:peroxisomal multifunctional enzyme type 2-like [Papilio machaon]
MLSPTTIPYSFLVMDTNQTKPFFTITVTKTNYKEVSETIKASDLSKIFITADCKALAENIAPDTDISNSLQPTNTILNSVILTDADIPEILNTINALKIDSSMGWDNIPSAILHGEQYIEFVSDFPGTEGEFTIRNYVVDILDKGSSAVAIVNSEIYQNKSLVFRTQQHVFVLGQGGFGGPRNSSKAVNVAAAPKRAPDAVVEQKTSEDQAALYRLSGDLNPLHIDPNVATAAGHQKPILHGLASLGFSVRHVLAKYGGNDASLVKAVKARFAKPVLPGQTLATEMWVEGTRVHFQTKTKETGNIVISGAFVDLKKVVKSGTAASSAPSQQSSSSLKSDGLFAKIDEQVKANPSLAKSIGAVYLYNITENGKTVKQWTLDLKTGSVHEGAPKSGKPDTTMTLSDEDLIALASGSLNPQTAFLKGKLKIAGNMMLAQKLQPLLKSGSKL